MTEYNSVSDHDLSTPAGVLARAVDRWVYTHAYSVWGPHATCDDAEATAFVVMSNLQLTAATAGGVMTEIAEWVEDFDAIGWDGFIYTSDSLKVFSLAPELVSCVYEEQYGDSCPKNLCNSVIEATSLFGSQVLYWFKDLMEDGCHEDDLRRSLEYADLSVGSTAEAVDSIRNLYNEFVYQIDVTEAAHALYDYDPASGRFVPSELMLSFQDGAEMRAWLDRNCPAQDGAEE